MNRSLRSAIMLAACAWAIIDPGHAEKVAVRCWRCGEVFAVAEQRKDPRCPACGAVCRREGVPEKLLVRCMGGSSSSSFLIESGDASAVAFVADDGAGGTKVAGQLKKAGIQRIDYLIGAEATRDNLRCVMEVIRRMEVEDIFDPGFKNTGSLYFDYIKLISEREITYHTVRAMDDFSLGSARLYLMRPEKVGAEPKDSGALSLCVVHGANCLMISGSLRARGSPAGRIPQLMPAGNTEFVVEGGTVSLRAVASQVLGDYPIVLESDGREIAVRALQQLSISSSKKETSGSHLIGESEGVISSAPPSCERAPMKININTAPAPELKALSGIGDKRARMIVQFREANGPFRRIDEIKKVPGIGEKLFQRNRDRISIH